jgi:hypothetical protein
MGLLTYYESYKYAFPSTNVLFIINVLVERCSVVLKIVFTFDVSQVAQSV